MRNPSFSQKATITNEGMWIIVHMLLSQTNFLSQHMVTHRIHKGDGCIWLAKKNILYFVSLFDAKYNLAS